MCKKWNRTLISAVLVVFMVCSSSLVHAQREYPTAEVNAGTMLFDVVFARPFGFLSMILGSATFLVSLPLTLPTGSTNEAAHRLIVDPTKYTFYRPLGLLEK